MRCGTPRELRGLRQWLALRVERQVSLLRASGGRSGAGVVPVRGGCAVNEGVAIARAVALALLGITIIFLAMAGIFTTLATPPPAPKPVVLPPCEQEDSENCYWDASTRGNGLGSSFVNIDGAVYYLGR